MNLWTIHLLFLIPLLLALGVMWLWLFMRRRAGRKFPFSDPVLRAPGEGLAQQIDDISFDFAAYSGLIPLAPVLAYAFYLQHVVIYERQPGLLAAVILFAFAAGASSYLVIRTLRLMNRLHAYRIGHAGEVAVGGALNQLMLKGYRVFHDIQGDNGFNIDHVVVGPTGVFAVETKTRTKDRKLPGTQACRVSYDGKALYFPDKPDYPRTQFLHQAERGAKWVGKWLSEAVGREVVVQAVLVLPGWYIHIRKPGPVMVLNHNQLNAITTVSRPGLEEEAIRQIAYQIQHKCRHEKLVPPVLRETKGMKQQTTA